MRSFDNVIVVVLHKKNIKYLEEFKKNLSLKNYDYDVIFFCDNILKKLNNSKNFIFLKLKKEISIVGVRNYIINYLVKKKYVNVMFADLEDFFENKRIKSTFKNLKKYDVVFNDINLFKNNKIYKKNIFKENFSNKKKINIKNIINSNFFGFCNTGVKVKYLTGIKVPKNIIAIDWWIFSLVLLRAKKIKFLKNISTNYRIDNMNIIGINKKINKLKLQTLIKIKYSHYFNMTRYCSDNFLNDRKKLFDQKLKIIKKIKYKSTNDKFNSELLNTINKKRYNFFNGWFNELSLDK